MTRKNNFRESTGNKYWVAAPPRLGRVRYKLKNEPFYRVIENVSKTTIKSEINKLFPDANIEYIGTLEEYEDYHEKCRRRYRENYMKKKNYEKLS